jgi:hypothetical protein
MKPVFDKPAIPKPVRLTTERLTEIRERDARAQEAFENMWDTARVADDDRHALLMHLAAMEYAHGAAEPKP